MIHLGIGWIGGILLAICAVPQVVKTWKTKKADDLSWFFLLFWFLGEVFVLEYLLIDDMLNKILHFPLYLNYSLNIVLIIYLVYAKYYY